ncbi:Gfo/Idh/MocA family protein [Deinococcus radiotolerans]|uniref:Glucose-fructose oxidoreductase n=1 Tax=Deinococcus radiotolerans TaxID=1309407 RepID=A0ABQ2FKU3_9DEIO|nr:Gfo/Idh/MocA family oxidoreductase [Deinococcus radiotolerans]GGK99619.1 glucose-fructose oxidoreductase [Deinococcus radiotolerans]
MTPSDPHRPGPDTLAGTAATHTPEGQTSTEPPIPPTLPQPRAQQVGYAVLGLGELTLDELLPAYATAGRSRLAAVVSDDHDKAVQSALAYGLSEADAYSYDTFEALAGRDDVQAVYIVLPNTLHREYTERAARIGKHVLCEKPLAGSVEDAEAMVRACRGAGVYLMTAYRCQYTPVHWRARDLVQSGELGAVKLIHAVNVQVEPDEGQWRLRRDLAGGGSLLDVGLYCINTVRFLLGTEPLEVTARTHSTPGDPRFTEVEESVSFQLAFPGGVLVSCSCSYGAAHARTLDVYGAQGRLSLDPAFDYTDLRLRVHTPDTITEHRLKESDQFTLEIDHFSRCIQERRGPFTPGEEGLQDERIMAAIYQSAREGRPVPLDEHPGRDVFRGAPPERPLMERA